MHVIIVLVGTNALVTVIRELQTFTEVEDLIITITTTVEADNIIIRATKELKLLGIHKIKTEIPITIIHQIVVAIEFCIKPNPLLLHLKVRLLHKQLL